MAALLDVSRARSLAGVTVSYIREASLPLLFLIALTFTFATLLFVYGALVTLAPFPRPPFPSEKTYITTQHDLSTSGARPLPSWHDNWLMDRQKASYSSSSLSSSSTTSGSNGAIQEADLEMTVVIPAYNEEARLQIMLEEAVCFLDAEYGRKSTALLDAQGVAHGNAPRSGGIGGYEILLVDDGSVDTTVDVALRFSRRHGLHDVLRIIRLKENRGKGGAVTHGFRHARGEYICFADADGASRFGDLGRLVRGCREVMDPWGRGVAVGSRAHLMDSDAVVKRSRLRNCLMHSFHIILRLATTTETSQIRDTQCGFKVFSRAALPHIIPYMHAEGWIFDVEMLMLAESSPPSINETMNGFGEGGNGRLHGDYAKVGQRTKMEDLDVMGRDREKAMGGTGRRTGIKVKEVPIEWKEVGGSKLNVVKDSLGMAWGLVILRAGWKAGVYRRQ